MHVTPSSLAMPRDQVDVQLRGDTRHCEGGGLLRRRSRVRHVKLCAVDTMDTVELCALNKTVPAKRRRRGWEDVIPVDANRNESQHSHATGRQPSPELSRDTRRSQIMFAPKYLTQRGATLPLKSILIPCSHTATPSTMDVPFWQWPRSCLLATLCSGGVRESPVCAKACKLIGADA